MHRPGAVAATLLTGAAAAASVLGTLWLPPAHGEAVSVAPTEIVGLADANAQAVRAELSDGDLVALDVLASIPVQAEQPSGYDRDLFGYPTIIENNCDTRAKVLVRDSLTPAQVDPFGCAVVAGDWLSVYDAVIWSDPAELQIDHVVALKEAWDSGAWNWSAERRRAFANDLTDTRSLRAVTAGVNLSKGDRDPSNWLPPDSGFVCEYLADWVSIKARWSLSMDQSEHGRIRNLFNGICSGQLIKPWGLAPHNSGDPTTTTTTTTVPSGNCDPSYPTVCIPPPPPDLDCADVPHRNFVVLQPDPHRFDGNKDGVGCTT